MLGTNLDETAVVVDDAGVGPYGWDQDLVGWGRLVGGGHLGTGVQTVAESGAALDLVLVIDVAQKDETVVAVKWVGPTLVVILVASEIINQHCQNFGN